MLPVIIIFERISLDTNIYIYKEKKRDNKILLIVAIEQFQRGEKEGELGGRRCWYRLIEGAQSPDNELQSPVTRNTEK